MSNISKGLIIFLFMCFCIQIAYADGGYIKGKIVDTDNKAIIGATVTVINFDLYESKIAKSSADGTYILEDLSAGDYEVTASAEGFNVSQKENISVSTNKVTSNIDFTLIRFGSISGKILEGDGMTPVPNANISAIGEVGFGEGISNVDGNVKICNEDIFKNDVIAGDESS